MWIRSFLADTTHRTHQVNQWQNRHKHLSILDGDSKLLKVSFNNIKLPGAGLVLCSFPSWIRLWLQESTGSSPDPNQERKDLPTASMFTKGISRNQHIFMGKVKTTTSSWPTWAGGLADAGQLTDGGFSGNGCSSIFHYNWWIRQAVAKTIRCVFVSVHLLLCA